MVASRKQIGGVVDPGRLYVWPAAAQEATGLGPGRLRDLKQDAGFDTVRIGQRVYVLGSVLIEAILEVGTRQPTNPERTRRGSREEMLEGVS